VPADTHKEFALEILMTIAPILDDGVQSLSFRLEGVQQVVPYEHVRELLGFHKEAPEKVDVPPGMLDGFWNLISGEAHQQRNCIRNPIIQVFHSWMCKRVLGTMRETKVTNTELNCQAANCRMDLPGPTTSVGTRTDYSVGPWDYPTCAARHLTA
jgi:hypothetical protein